MFRLFLLMVCFTTVARELAIDAYLSPRVSIHENGSFSQEGESEFVIEKARIGFTYKERLGNIPFRARCRVAFEEDSFEESIHRLHIASELGKSHTFSFGRDKSLFGLEYNQSSFKLPAHFRSLTTDHIKDDLHIGGIRDGLSYRFSLKEFPLSFAVAIYNSDNDKRAGFVFDKVFSSTQFQTALEIKDIVTISYNLALSRFSNSLLNGRDTTLWIPISEFGFSFDKLTYYEGLTSVFIGPDTTTGATLKTLSPEYDENVSLSIFSSHSLLLPVKGKLLLRVTMAGEFLNGLNYYNGDFHTRDYNYALTGAIALDVEKRFSIFTAARERFQSDLSLAHTFELEIGCSYRGTAEIGKKR